MRVRPRSVLSILVAAGCVAGATAAVPAAGTAAPVPAPPPPAAPGAPAAQAPAPAVTAPARRTRPAAPAAGRPLALRVGARGAVVRDLQRELRRRGMRYVAVDGRYGPLTARGVRTMQRRFGWRPNGVASVGVLARLGISVRRVASVRPTAGVPATGAGRAPAGGRDRYLRSFPVLGGYAYTDTFGAPRSQGSHEGTDIMAARGTALVAVADGRITRLTRTATGLGGIWVWMADAAGTTYYYAHMTTIATGLAPGSPVRAGQLIGTVGNTGDARYGAPHLHFEIHPGGGRAVNPYRHLRAVDPAV